MHYATRLTNAFGLIKTPSPVSSRKRHEQMSYSRLTHIIHASDQWFVLWHALRSAQWWIRGFFHEIRWCSGAGRTTNTTSNAHTTVSILLHIRIDQKWTEQNRSERCFPQFQFHAHICVRISYFHAYSVSLPLHHPFATSPTEDELNEHFTYYSIFPFIDSSEISFPDSFAS